MDDSIPIADSLAALYEPDAIPSQEQRWARLKTKFADLYPAQAIDFVARSPGRVNLIGEHVDYSLYNVLPMAIAADVLVAVAASTSQSEEEKEEEEEEEEEEEARVSINDVDSDHYACKRFDVPKSCEVEIDASTLEWTNYFKAGLNGAFKLLKEKGVAFAPKTLHVLVDGNVPAGGGLSSSAAFVCASALAVLYAHDHSRSITKRELTELAIVSERSVGVNSGGMDQAASVCSVKGDALSVSFSPQLQTKPIAFPKLDPPITFLIAQSFVTSDKHVTAPECYNLRVVECTLAAEVLAVQLNLELKEDSSPLGKSLRGFQNAYCSKWMSEAEQGEFDRLLKMQDLIANHLDSTGYTLEQIAEILQLPVSELESRYLTKFPVRAERFQLRDRAQHVFEEAIRVLTFKRLLESPPEAELLHQLGALMNDTQYSCQHIYECSCPELDDICSIASKAGSYGSRLTGAGWGGCTVHLVPKDRVGTIIEALTNEYYRKRFPDISEEKLAEAIVVSEPGQGSMM